MSRWKITSCFCLWIKKFFSIQHKNIPSLSCSSSSNNLGIYCYFFSSLLILTLLLLSLNIDRTWCELIKLCRPPVSLLFCLSCLTPPQFCDCGCVCVCVWVNFVISSLNLLSNCKSRPTIVCKFHWKNSSKNYFCPPWLKIDNKWNSFVATWCWGLIVF